MLTRCFRVLTYPDKRLSERSDDVRDITGDLLKKIDRMWSTMYKNNGVGLAAPQVGLLLRVVVADVAAPRDSKKVQRITRECQTYGKLTLINPVITESSDECSFYDEGCLSVPGAQVSVERPSYVQVRYYDRDMHEHMLEAGGLLATCIQHEIDHLDGVLMIDRVDLRDRARAIDELIEYKRTHDR